MYNIYKLRKEEAKTKKASPPKLSLTSRNKKVQYLNEMCARANNRREKRIAEQLSSLTLIPSLHKGSIPLLHPSSHKFRDVDPSKFLGQRTMLGFSHVPGAERAAMEQTKHRALFLSSTEPVQFPSPHVFRPTEIVSAIQPRLQIKPYHDNERVLDMIKVQPLVNLEQINSKMMHFHDFRDKQPCKWMSDKDMMAWKRNCDKLLEGVKNYTPALYKNGFDENIILRDRDKTKDVASSTFSSVIPKDVWQNRLHQDQSIRMYKSLEFKQIQAKKGGESASDFQLARSFHESHNKQYSVKTDALEQKKVYFQSLYGYFPRVLKPGNDKGSERNLSEGLRNSIQQSKSTSSLRSPSLRGHDGSPQVITEIVHEYLEH